ncbi:alkaline phosphatase [Motilimonas cestriensis]|uniref:Alkaline phosphatase n=1 Tax=Motilimonas cestriensis TaxID=2742685 RepID=A0ABS8WGZ2_9GAMM|nr:alkaline phosphatase [Motilimonas cestriensis]MCE2597036.1 alkaline phosphatase [Motilimonas cestriensis]
MKLSLISTAITAVLVLSGCGSSNNKETTEQPVPVTPVPATPAPVTPEPVKSALEKLYETPRTNAQKQAINTWYEAGQAELAQAQQVFTTTNALASMTLDPVKSAKISTKKAKNIILFVGDGMGISTVTAARILAGQKQGQTGEEYMLSFDQFPFTALSKTYNTNQQTPDSAGTMTAMMTGVKSKAGVISVGEKVIRGNCASVAGNELTSALTLAELAGKKTGIISTARITHATPAATYAVSPERNWESDSNIPSSEKAAGCVDIAQQLVDYNYGDGIEVVLGGGLRQFIPTTEGGKRKDNQDLTQVWLNKGANRAFVSDKASLDAVDTASTDKLMGLFTSSHMSYETDRPSTEPSLTNMTNKALDMLTKDEDKGFFLMVESGRIDHGHHAGNAYRALTDAVEFSNAIEAAVKHQNIDLSETLIIVTADHSHVFTIAGYPTRGNPILGKVITNDSAGNPELNPSLDLNGMPYTTVGYTNGPGAWLDGAKLEKNNNGRVDLSQIDTSRSDFNQEALVPLGSETHAGEDVGIYAVGPWAHLFQGTLEQNLIFHVMNHAGELTQQANL